MEFPKANHAPGSNLNLPSRMKMIGCKESYVEFFVDPGEAQRNLPSRYLVKQYPNRKAVLLILLQEWEKCVLDGFFPVRGVRMAHIWIELAGPAEIGPALPGTDSSLPTSYYYALPHQMDHQVAVLAFKLAGIDVQLVDRIEVSGKPGENQRVLVIERERPATGYSWEARGNLSDTPKIVTGRRWFYRNYGRIIKRQSAGLVTCRSRFFGEGEVDLSIDRGSTLWGLGIGTQLKGALQYVTTDCDCVIRVGRG